MIEATSDLVCLYKPNIAFYEGLGTEGHELLRRTLEAVPAGIPVLIDAKRGDIGSTAEAYARSLFDVLNADAITVSPYLGRDAVQPFLDRADRGVFVLARTSNPGARDLQNLQVATADGQGEPLYLAVARLARSWNEHGNVGLVAGATYPEEVRQIRSVCPDLPFLVPGIGSQEGDLAAACAAAEGPGGFFINVSRAVIYAGASEDIRATALRYRDAINRAMENDRTPA